MGLLDIGDEGLLGLHLMAAAAPRERRIGLGEGLLGAIQGVRANRAAEEDRKARRQMQEMQMQEYQSQIAQRQAMALEMQRKAQEAARIQSLIQGSVMPVGPSEAMAGGGGPSPANAAMLGQRKPIDYQALMAQGVPPELVQKLAESANYGRQEVARTVETMEGGRPATVQFDKFGGRVGDALPQWKAPVLSDQGGQIAALDPVTLAKLAQFQKTNSPDSVLSALTARRGQDMTDARSREKNSIDKAATGKVEWKQDVDGNWIGLPKEPTGPQPVMPITTSAPGKRQQQASNALGIIKEAKTLIDDATGSYLGAGMDQAARAVGWGTDSGQAAAKLKALEGALMMSQPRMEGPQSDKDVALYRQMAGQIGDSTVPASTKRAALDVIERLHQRYAGGQQSAPSVPPNETVLRFNPQTGRFD